MVKYLKSLVLVLAVTSLSFSAAIGTIDGHVVTGSGGREFAAIKNAVIAVNTAKRQRADRIMTAEQYKIAVKNILNSLRSKGVTVK